MIVSAVQRWHDRRATYRPAREVIDVRAFEVSSIRDDTTARAFVERHHYSGSYPAARFRFGLHERGELVGVAVFSQPVNDRSLACLPGTASESAELGRLVLLDRVGANAETWFVARCFDRLRDKGLVGVVSFADDLARRSSSGDVVFPGHVGTIYQAGNACYLGRGSPGTLRVLPNGTVLARRAIAKLNTGTRGWRYTADLLVEHGARSLEAGEDRRAWARASVLAVTRSLRHPGAHKYAWTLHRRDRRHLPASLPYPKITAARAA